MDGEGGYYDPSDSEAVSQTEETTFDTSGVSQHAYLGDFQDLDGSEPLEEGSEHRIPCIRNPGVVLFPGMVLPLKPVDPWDIGACFKALGASPPLRGYILIPPEFPEDSSMPQVGCLSIIQQVGLGENRNINVSTVITHGKQRVALLTLFEGHETVMPFPVSTALVKILPKEYVPRLPREIHEGCGRWPSWAVQQLDPYALANLAYDKAAAVLPKVKDMRDDPCLFSYWLAASLPISYSMRLALLCEDSVTYRLRKELDLIGCVSGIFCLSCGERLANARDVIVMSDVGPSDVFVNAHGFLHDLTTVKRVQKIKLRGEPLTAHSWFDGYAWTLAFCATCFCHIGWRYTSVRSDLCPRCFWGFSRATITHCNPEE